MIEDNNLSIRRFVHTPGEAQGVEILRSQPKGEGIRMNTNIAKAQTAAEATEVTTQATSTTTTALKDAAKTARYHISGNLQEAQAKMEAAKIALEAAQAELELAKMNDEFEQLCEYLINVNSITFIECIRYAVQNSNTFPAYVPYDCPNADDAYCSVIVETARKAGKEVEGDLLLTIVRKDELSSYEFELCVKAWLEIKLSK